MFWVMLALYAATTVLSGLLQKAPKIKASSLGELEVPTAQEGRSIPVIFGTCLLKAPNVTWYGDLKTKPIKKSMGIMAFGRKATIGYRYLVGMDMALCHGQVDALVDVLTGQGEDVKPVKWSAQGTNADGSLEVLADDWNCFGGDEKEGGIYGPGTFYYGSKTQGSDAYMSAQLGIVYPAYRTQCHFVARQWYLGTSQYIKPLAFVLRRCPNNLGLTEAQRNISGDANPAEIIYELLRARAWALGFPQARCDVQSFKDAGITLAAEGMGMSFQIDRPEDADSAIETVLQHIDGVCYTDPSTGLWTLKLVRATDPAMLPEYGPGDILEAEFTRGSWDATVNEVKVSYTDRSTWKGAMVQAQETANYAVRGELASTTMDFPGFSNPTIAQKVCTREMRVHSYPAGKGRVQMNRKGWPLRMGSAFLFTWPALGISKMPVRVTSIDYGRLDAGAIEAEIVEDIFNVAYTAYTVPSGSGWTNPAGAPAAPLAQLVQEVPYQAQGSADRNVLCGAVRGDGLSDYYEVWSDEGAGFYLTNTVDVFCPSGLLVGAYARTTAATDNAGFAVTGTDLDDLVSTDAAGLARGDNLLVIVDAGGSYEWCAWQTVTKNGDGSYTVSKIVRGIFDTVPLDHAAGARVYFVANGGTYNTAVTRSLPLGADQLVKVKCLPHNPQGTVPIANVAQVQLNTASRAQKPYPPGAVKIAGQYWPNGARLGAVDVTLTWAHRNRTAQAGAAIVAQDAASVGAGPEGTYTVEVLVDGIVKRTQAAIAGTSFTYTMAQRTADNADLTKPVQFRITPVNGALSGQARLTDAFVMQP